MEEFGLLRDLATAWLAALFVGAGAVRLKLPVIAGYIVAGLLIGPYAGRLISDVAQIKVLAELGVALLLFALGVELSIKKVFTAAGRVTLSALSQIVLTVLVAMLLAVFFGLVDSFLSAFIFGFVCALSSTAVVTKLLVDRSETETPHGRLLVPILLVQDLSLVPVVALLPALKLSSAASIYNIALALAAAGLLIAFVAGAAMTIVPRLLAFVSRTNSRELFLLTVISLCLVVAITSQHLGVSLALGAFLGGIMVSERPYGHQVLSDISPLRDLFAALFFVSVGMLLDPAFILSRWFEVSCFVVMLILGKALIACACARLATNSLWTAALTAIGLAQIGEFSFVLATLGHTCGLLSQALYNLFFAGAVVSLALSPALIVLAPRLLALAPRFRLLSGSNSQQALASQAGMRGHLILCGFGRMGHSIGLALHAYRIPLLVIEINGEVISDLELRGIPYIYGDAFSQLVLRKANLHQAKCLLVTIPDPVVALNVITFARSQSQDIRIIARAVRSGDIELFRAAGAHAVIQPEFEASIEATRLALVSMRRPRSDILKALRDIRQRGYMIFRPQLLSEPFVEYPPQDFFGVWFSYQGSEAQSIETLDIRRRTGATILAIKHASQLIAHPDPSLPIQPLDELYVAGDDQQLFRFEQAFPVARFCPISEATSNEISSS